VKVAVLPLVRKDGQPELARRVWTDLRERVQAEYDEGGAIGRRYRRQDEIGTPWAVTIDHQSLEDDTVTLRDRDSLAQDRIAISALGDEIERRLRAPWTSPKIPFGDADADTDTDTEADVEAEAARTGLRRAALTATL
jgi:glycyl-tRNA synthetase